MIARKLKVIAEIFPLEGAEISDRGLLKVTEPNNNIRLIRRYQNTTCYNDMDKTIKKHEMTEVLDCFYQVV